MTTIACDGSVMAGDGARWRNGTMMVSDARKVHRLDDGSILGISGDDSNDCRDFLEWFTGDRRDPQPSGEPLSALHLKRDGTIDYWSETGGPVASAAPTAIGSGTELALGAMLAGATPVHAVGVACERDSLTGGTIRAEALR